MYQEMMLHFSTHADGQTYLPKRLSSSTTQTPTKNRTYSRVANA